MGPGRGSSSPCATSASCSVRLGRSTGSTSTSAPVRCTRCSARTVRARAPWPASPPVCSSRPRGRCSSTVEEIVLRSVRAAESEGILLIPQELQLFDPLSVAENLFVGRPRPRFPWGTVDGRRMRAWRGERWPSSGSTSTYACRSSGSSLATRQLVAIARALVLEVRVLIMDEPTAALDDWEAERLLGIVRELANSWRGDRVRVTSARRGPSDRRHGDGAARRSDGRLGTDRRLRRCCPRSPHGRAHDGATDPAGLACHRTGRPAGEAACPGGGRSRMCPSSFTPARCSGSPD